MDKRKPNVLLTVSLVMLVVAALICMIVFLSTRNRKTSGGDSQISDDITIDSGESGQEGSEATSDTENTDVPQTPAEHDYDEVKLKGDLDDCLDGLDSTWQVVVIDLADGTKVGSYANCTQVKTLTAGDLTKLFVMAAAYDQVSQEKLTEDQITDLVSRMIREGSTQAANDLTKLIGGGDAASGRAAVNAFAASIGCAHVEFNSLFGESGSKNMITADDCAELMRQIGTGTCVSADASAKMLEVLTGLPGDQIPAGVPEGTTVAHLNANTSQACCSDVGIVMTGKRMFALAIICDKPFNNDRASAKCVGITEIVCNHLCN